MEREDSMLADLSFIAALELHQDTRGQGGLATA